MRRDTLHVPVTPFYWAILTSSGTHSIIMAKKALSDRVKALNRAKSKEETLQKTVAAYQRKLAKPNPKDRKGSRDIAQQFGIPEQYKTIQN